ncbi:MAG TPA: CHAD domain-containing protein [Pirellulales bacterium]|jgi:CHAD domain-containing protein|nr:CHAD domain-containing protein [Pirellulales bacterium]
MTRKSKWIDVESVDEPAVAVARRAIRARMRTVWEWAPLAADQATEDVEYIHQLRVSTRRARAALQLFENMLPRKRSRWFRKQLKRLREAAGEARDLDVLAQHVGAVCEADHSPGCGSLLERISEARRAAQPAITEIYHKLKQRAFRRRVKKLVGKIRWRSDNGEAPSYSTAAQIGLRPLATAFFLAAEADFESILAVHEFRIAGKHLRYAMEVFAAAFNPIFRKELYPVVEELQNKLGAVNDRSNNRDRCLAWLDETRDESQRLILSKIISLETTAFQAAMREFRQWWTPERTAELKARFWQEIAPSEARCA